METKYRGFMFDSARCLERRDYYRRAIQFAAERGMNTVLWHFTDDQGCSLEFESVPGVGSPNAYTKAELRELIRFARGLGVELIPELASLGHCVYITRLAKYAHLNESTSRFSGMCPVAPETRPVLTSLINEALDVFDCPDFHVGLDEANIGGHPLTQASLLTQTKAEITADHINFIHDLVAVRGGRRMWMWADGVLHDRAITPRLPRDIVMCDWQYRPTFSGESTQYLLDEGFDVVLCSALISHDQTLFPGERFSVPNVRVLEASTSMAGRGKVLGHLATIWTPVRFIADSLWLGLDLAAAILREGPLADARGTMVRFAKRFYGLSTTDAERVADVGQTLLYASPMRREWLPVAKVEVTFGLASTRAGEAASGWSAALATLESIADRVRTHRAEFDAFMLLLEILSHTYHAAAEAADPETSQARLASLVAQRERLIEKVSQTWDRERFADDPRKHVAPIAHFQDDHLVPLLQQGLDALRDRYAASVGSTVSSAGKRHSVGNLT